MYMYFATSKTPIEVITEGVFGGTYFRAIYSSINGKWNRKSRREFEELKNVDQKYYCSNCYDISVNKYKVKMWSFFKMLGI